MSQPFLSASSFGLPAIRAGGRYGAKFKEIVAGTYDHLPEQAFFMVGTIEEAWRKAEKMKG